MNGKAKTAIGTVVAAVTLAVLLFTWFHNVANTQESVAAHQKAIETLQDGVEANSDNQATTAVILERVNRNLELLNAWQLEQQREQGEMSGRLDALERDR